MTLVRHLIRLLYCSILNVSASLIFLTPLSATAHLLYLVQKFHMLAHPWQLGVVLASPIPHPTGPPSHSQPALPPLFCLPLKPNNSDLRSSTWSITPYPVTHMWKDSVATSYQGKLILLGVAVDATHRNLTHISTYFILNKYVFVEKNLSPLYFPDEEKSPYLFMPYIKYHVYKNKTRCGAHGLWPLIE